MQQQSVILICVGLVAVVVAMAAGIFMGRDSATGDGEIPDNAARVPDGVEGVPGRMAAPGGPPSDGDGGTSEQGVMVEIQGAVARPGYYAFSADARLWDALAKAGGVTADAETADLNIAARLIDGSVLSVPYRTSSQQGAAPAATLNPPEYTRSGWGGAPVGVVPDGANTTAPVAALVNINSASQDELELLPGVGPKTAEKILQFRRQQSFDSVEDLRLVPGIGEKRVETLRPLVTVE